MIYLIGHLSVWLLLTAAFAGLVGWAYAAQRAAPREQALRRERDHLLGDIARIAGGEPAGDGAAAERELDSLHRLIDVRDGRIAELERALESARSRADEAASRIAELERAPAPGPAEQEELSRLRALVAEHQEARDREVEVEAAPVAEEDQSAALQGWRLRYFEQRVRYLEGLAAQASEAHAPTQEDATPPIAEWRAREASARAAYLENSLREALSSPAAAPAEAAPFAADAEMDMLMRWRLLYLERRVAHLQGRLAAQETAAPAPPAETGPEPDRWRWRARYLEARIRHFEQRTASPAASLAQPVGAAVQPIAAPAAPEPPAIRPQRPETLPAARNGAPDDFTLIEDVSVLQQTTLYSIGVFHFDQIAAWTPANVAWVDQYLRLRGRIEDEEWVAQARDLAERGVHASWRSREPAEA